MNNDLNDPSILRKLESISEHLAPIFWLQDHVIDFYGTSIVFEWHGTQYLVTAAHVVRSFNHRRYGIVFDKSLQPIPFDRMCKIEHENVDLAVFRLERPICNHPIRSIIDDSFKITPNDKIMLAGFPHSKFKARRDNFESSPRFVFTQLNPVISTKHTDHDNNVNFYCDFTKQNTKFLDGTIGTFPNPNGMSGGPALLCEIVDGLLTAWSLAGILTDWDSRGQSFIRCTRAEIVLEIIEKINSSAG
jgi:hypothetical protein